MLDLAHGECSRPPPGANGAPALRVRLVSPMIVPSRSAFLNALAAIPGIHLHVIHLHRRHRRPGGLRLDGVRYPFTILAHGGLRQELLSWGGRLLRRLARDDFDLVIVPGLDHPAYVQAVLCARARRRRAVVWTGDGVGMRREGHRLQTALERVILGLCDGFLAHGEGALERLLSLGVDPSRIHTVPDVPDTAAWRSSVEERAREGPALRRRFGLPGPIVLSAGRLRRGRGFEDLIAAHREIEGMADLVLVGEGPMREGLRRQAATRGWRRVHIPRIANGDGLAAWHAAADIFVLPGGRRAPGRPIGGDALEDAMSAGLPVIAVAGVAGVPDLLRRGQGGIVVPPGDVPALAAALRSLLLDGARRRALGRAALDLAASRSPRKAARDMEAALRAIAAPAGGGGRLP